MSLKRTVHLAGMAILLAMAPLLPSPSTATALATSPLHGIWRNPAGTVTIRIADCGPQICGTVIAASPDAIGDARDSGYPGLVGMTLMRGMRSSSGSHWRGTILVPDLGRSFPARIDLTDNQRARATGCLWRDFLCRSQTWQRL